MFCPNCGTKCNDDDLFCGSCGTSLAEYREEETAAEVPVEPPVEPAVEVPVEPPVEPPVMTYAEAPAPAPVKKEKLSKISMLLIGEVLVMAVLLIGIYISFDKKYSAESAALEYWKAKADCDWNKVYDYYSFDDTDILSRQMYVNAHMNDDEPLKYRSAEVEKGATQKKADAASYTIAYIPSDGAGKEYEMVSLVKGDKKFLFWNEWYVVSTDEVVEEWSVTVPKNAAVKLNGEELKVEKDSDINNMKEVLVSNLFKGTYQLEVSEDGMETYKDIVEIESGASGEWITLVPTEEEREKLAKQLGEDMEKILNAAVAKKDFSEVKELFSEEAGKRSYVKSSYEDLYRITDTEGTVIQSFSISDITMSTNNYYESEGKLTFDVDMKINTAHTSFWSEEVETQEQESSGTVTYVKEEDGWKLQNLPISYYDILY